MNVGCGAGKGVTVMHYSIAIMTAMVLVLLLAGCARSASFSRLSSSTSFNTARPGSWTDPRRRAAPGCVCWECITALSPGDRRQPGNDHKKITEKPLMVTPK